MDAPRPPLLTDEQLLDLDVLVQASDLSKEFREHCRAALRTIVEQQEYLRGLTVADGLLMHMASNIFRDLGYADRVSLLPAAMAAAMAELRAKSAPAATPNSVASGSTEADSAAGFEREGDNSRVPHTLARETSPRRRRAAWRLPVG